MEYRMVLVLAATKSDISAMAITAKETARSPRSVAAERTIGYRGSKISPMSDRRSAAGKAIRDALRAKSGQASGEPAHT